jgi:hypothetical protein
MIIGLRKEIYERKHSETKHGVVGNGRKKSRQVGDSTEAVPDRFTKDTYKKTGTPDRGLQARGELQEQGEDMRNYRTGSGIFIAALALAGGEDLRLPMPPVSPVCLPEPQGLPGAYLLWSVGRLWRWDIAPKLLILLVVGAEGFEPPAPCSQSRCSTRLSYAPTKSAIYFNMLHR